MGWFKRKPPAEPNLCEEDFHSKKFSLNYMTTLLPEERLVYAQEHEAEIAALSDKQKERIGTLLCHASSEMSRGQNPIIGDLKADRLQEKFETLASAAGAELARELVSGGPLSG